MSGMPGDVDEQPARRSAGGSVSVRREGGVLGTHIIRRLRWL